MPEPAPPTPEAPLTIQLPNTADVEADLSVILHITRQQRDAWANTAAFWQAAHAQLLVQHGRVVEQLTKRIAEASAQPEGGADDSSGGTPAAAAG
jgi:hypothetical protein